MKALLMLPRRSLVRHAVFSAAFVVVYFFLNQPSVILVSQLGYTAWYPAVGLILAVMLGISPWYVFLAWFCDALAGSVIYHQPLLSFSEAVGAVGTAMCYLIAACILRGPLHIDLGLRRRQDVLRYILVTLGMAMVSTCIGVSCLAADHLIPWSDFRYSALGWFFGDAIGLLGFAPFLLIHVLPWVRKHLGTPGTETAVIEKPIQLRPPHQPNLLASLEAAAQTLALVGVVWVIFGTALRGQDLLYLSFVPIIWVAMRQGIRRVVTALLVLNFGIVVALHLFSSPAATVSRVSLLMLVVSAVGLSVGSVVTERHRMGLDLQERTVYWNSLIENSPMGIAVLDCQARVELTNPAFRELFLYDRSELEQNRLEPLICPPDQPEEDKSVLSTALAGRALQRTVKRRRKDGQLLDIELHAVPILANGLVRGALTIYKDISEQIKAAQAEREHAQSLNRLIAQMEVHSYQMTLLNEMAGLLECCTNFEESGTIISRYLPRLFPDARSGTLYLFKSSRNMVEAAEKWGQPGASDLVFAPEACWALRRGRPHWSEHDDSGICCTHLIKNGSGRILCVPMIGKTDTIGTLLLEFGDASRDGNLGVAGSPRNSEQELAVTVASQIAIQLASLRLRETLRDQSIRDAVTGLFNRRFMEESLERELLRGARKNHPVSLIFLDLDHFKRFNDSFGHHAGDLVLRSIAELFRNFFRGDDVICRYGGEEFAIILPESSGENAFARADALREAVKRLRPQHDGLTLGQVTVSIGVASFPEHALHASDLLQAADVCLYESKKGGRDRVSLATRIHA